MASLAARYIASYVSDAVKDPDAAGDAYLLAKTVLALMHFDTDVPVEQLATALQTTLGENGVPSLD